MDVGAISYLLLIRFDDVRKKKGLSDYTARRLCSCGSLLVLYGLFKSQQLIAIVFILLLPGFDFGGETDGNIVAERVKAVKDADNFILHLKRGDGDIYFIQNSLCQAWYTASFI